MIFIWLFDWHLPMPMWFVETMLLSAYNLGRTINFLWCKTLLVGNSSWTAVYEANLGTLECCWVVSYLFSLIKNFWTHLQTPLTISLSMNILSTWMSPTNLLHLLDLDHLSVVSIFQPFIDQMIHTQIVEGMRH